MNCQLACRHSRILQLERPLLKSKKLALYEEASFDLQEYERLAGAREEIA